MKRFELIEHSNRIALIAQSRWVHCWKTLETSDGQRSVGSVHTEKQIFFLKFNFINIIRNKIKVTD